MRRFGFTYTGGPTAKQPDAKQLPATHYRLYGLLDEEHARAYGYHGGPMGSPSKYAGASKNLSRDYLNVVAAKLGGGSYKGQQIPRGGCIGEARRQLIWGGPAYNSSLPEQLSNDSWRQSNSDSRVVAAFRTWSSCMATSGYKYKTPIEANDDNRWGGDRWTKAEVAVAVADVRCKKRTNLTGIRMAVDSAYQQTAIRAHDQDLKAIKNGQQRLLRNTVLTLAQK